MTNSKTKNKRKEFSDDLSLNRGKSIRYRVRVQEDKETKQELKKYKHYNKDVDADQEV